MIQFDIFTLFPQMFQGPFDESIIKRAQEAGLIDIRLHQIRDYATDKHQVTDDTPYGGGGGMVMKPDPLFRAVEHVLELPERRADVETPPSPVPIILLTPQGRVLNQQVAQELAQHPRLALICGRYEGFDERVRAHLATDEISIGDFVLSGGELAAMIVVDAVTRLLPGALGDPTGAEDDSHAMGLLEYPQYTRPANFRGWPIPDVLVSGHHGQIALWRRREALTRTLARRPDMLVRAPLTPQDHKLLLDIATPPPPQQVTGNLTYETRPHPDQETLSPLRQGLDQFNRRHIGDYHYEQLAVVARDAAGQLWGGVEGELYWDWLHIKTLWVHPSLRAQGIGSTLLAQMEAEAQARDIHRFHLETTSFQALDFYHRHGYTTFGTLDNKPTGVTWYYLKKELA